MEVFFGEIKKDQIEGFGIYCSFDFSDSISKLSDPKDTNFNIDSFYKDRIKRDKLNYSSEKILAFVTLVVSNMVIFTEKELTYIFQRIVC